MPTNVYAAGFLESSAFGALIALLAVPVTAWVTVWVTKRTEKADLQNRLRDALEAVVTMRESVSQTQRSLYREAIEYSTGPPQGGPPEAFFDAKAAYYTLCSELLNAIRRIRLLTLDAAILQPLTELETICSEDSRQGIVHFSGRDDSTETWNALRNRTTKAFDDLEHAGNEAVAAKP